MRVKHTRRNRKLLTYFRAAHGFKPPFTVLLDGTAIQAALNHGVTLSDSLPRILGGQVRLVVPRSVVAELHALGRNFAAAAKFARRLKIVGGRNGDAAMPADDAGDDDADGAQQEPPETKRGAAAAAADDLTALVAGGNPEHHFVVTEDADLRQRLSRLSAVPLLRFARGRLVLEAPSRQDAGGGASSASSTVHASVAPSKEGAMGASAGRKRARDEGSGAAVATSDGGADASRSSPVKKPKHGRNPNPLSVKKKKKKASASPTRPKEGAAAEGGPSHRRRKKRRSGGLEA